MANFKFNDGFFDELGRSPEVKALTRSAAEKVAAQMRGSAPRDTGNLAGSVKVEESPRGGRVVYRVGSDEDYALAVEARTGWMARAVKHAR